MIFGKYLLNTGIKGVNPNTNESGLTILKEWTTTHCRNMPSTTNLEEEVPVDDLVNDGNVSMTE
jgi:hypothetical protein